MEACQQLADHGASSDTNLAVLSLQGVLFFLVMWVVWLGFVVRSVLLNVPGSTLVTLGAYRLAKRTLGASQQSSCPSHPASAMQA